MTEKIKLIYKAALKDEGFNRVIWEADGDKKPSRWSPHNEKVVYASFYYGWLISRYGSDWRKFV